MEKSLSKNEFPCWTCASSDAAVLYIDGSKSRVHCFSCGATTFDEEIVEEYMTGAPELTEKPTAELKVVAPSTIEHQGDYTSLPDRKISKRTAERYGVKSLFDTSGNILTRSYPVYNQDELVATKIKNPNDKSKMRCTGSLSKGGLFGQNIFPAGSNKYITITEGEEDALSVYEMMGSDRYDCVAVSITAGASAAISNCEREWEYINSFENVVVCFDQDEAGQKAAKAVAKLFPGKSRIVKMEEDYDANRYLSEGKKEQFTKAWHNAETIKVKGVYEFGQLWDEMTKEDSFTTAPYPWKALTDKTYGMRTGELTIVKAPPKIGKTEFLREISYYLHSSTDFHSGIVFLEEGLKRIAQGYVSKQLNKPLHLPDTRVSSTELRTGFDSITSKGQLHIFDPASEISVENLFDKMMYFVQVKKCKFIFIDHISMFAYKAQSFDERRFIDGFVADLKSFATANDVHIMAVIHVNDDGKTRGSRAPVQLCNTLISIARDKLSSDPIVANTTRVVVEENRYNGDMGHAVDLLYDKQTTRMNEIDPLDNLDFDEEEEEKDVKFGE